MSMDLLDALEKDGITETDIRRAQIEEWLRDQVNKIAVGDVAWFHPVLVAEAAEMCANTIEDKERVDYAQMHLSNLVSIAKELGLEVKWGPKALAYIL